jgi:methylmalonyl-CoA/ethylmalonyl-CoA epimerase
MKVEKIDHIAIFVKDLEKATKFFTDVLGTEFTEPTEVEQFGFINTFEPLGVELVQPVSADSGIAKTIERKGEGVALIGLKVPNIDEAIAEAQSLGLKLISKRETGHLKTAQFHPKDSFGVFIELLEYKVKHPIYLARQA